jgi:hypothetical protein
MLEGLYDIFRQAEDARTFRKASLGSANELRAGLVLCESGSTRRSMFVTVMDAAWRLDIVDLG